MKDIHINLHKGSLKLASLYLAIIMVISLFFSINIYQLSTQELERGLRGPGRGIERQIGLGYSQEIQEDILAEREELYREATQRVLERLIVTNLVILVAGGFLSYYLALRTLKPIEQAHESQNRFTADASHELRTPITVMLTENEVALMDERLTLPQAKAQLESNIEELRKLTSLSEGLMRLAGLDNATLYKQPVIVSAVLQAAVDRTEPTAVAKNITVIVPKTDDYSVLGDDQSLQELFVILLDNAIKYSPEKSKITVTSKLVQNNVTISVADRGIGIKATEIPHIFDRFYRADASRTKQHISGYGLGLAIAKNIVDLHEGTIHVTSKLTKGSTFIVTLPLAGNTQT